MPVSLEDEINQELIRGDQQIRSALRQRIGESATDPYFAPKQAAYMGDLFDRHMAPALRRAGAGNAEITAARIDYGNLLAFGDTNATGAGSYGPGAEPDLFLPNAPREVQNELPAGGRSSEPYSIASPRFVAPLRPSLFVALGSVDNSLQRGQVLDRIQKGSSGFAGGAARGLTGKAIGAAQLVSGLFGDRAREAVDREFAPEIYSEAYLQDASDEVPAQVGVGEFAGRALPDFAGGIGASKLVNELGVESLKTSARGGLRGLATRGAGRALEGAAAATPAALTEMRAPGETIGPAEVGVQAGIGAVAEVALGGAAGYLFDRYAKKRLAQSAAKIPTKEITHRMERAVFSNDSLVTAAPKKAVELQKQFPFLKRNPLPKRGYEGSVQYPDSGAALLRKARGAEKSIEDAVGAQYEDILKPVEKTATNVLNRTAKPDVSGLGPTPRGVDINGLTNVRNSIDDLAQRFDSGLATIDTDSPVMLYVRGILESTPDARGFGTARIPTKSTTTTGAAQKLTPEPVMGSREFLPGVDDPTRAGAPIPTIERFTFDAAPRAGSISPGRGTAVTTRPFVGFAEAREIRKVLGAMSVDETLSQAERSVAARVKHALMNDYEDALTTLAKRSDLSAEESAAIAQVLPDLKAANKLHGDTVAVFHNSKGLNSALREFLDNADAGGRSAEQLGDVLTALGESNPEYAKKMIQLADEYRPGFRDALQRTVMRRAMRGVGPEDVPMAGKTPEYASLGDLADITTELGTNPKYANIFDDQMRQKFRIIGRSAKAADEYIGKSAQGSRTFAHVRGESIASKGKPGGNRLAETDFRSSTEVFEQLPLWLNTAQGQRALAELSQALPTEVNKTYNATRIALSLRDMVHTMSASLSQSAIGGSRVGSAANKQGAASARRAGTKGSQTLLDFLTF